MRGLLISVALLLALAACGGGEDRESSLRPAPEDPVWRELEQKAARDGLVPVIVTLRIETQPEDDLTPAGEAAQRRRIRDAQETLIGELEGTRYEALKTFETIPVLAAHMSSEALAVLRTSGLVAAVEEDRPSAGA